MKKIFFYNLKIKIHCDNHVCMVVTYYLMQDWVLSCNLKSIKGDQ